VDKVLEWLSSPANPPVRYLVARDLGSTDASDLAELRSAIFDWPPLVDVLALQRDDGGFPSREKPESARATFWALRLMARCGLDLGDDPVSRAVEYLEHHHHHEALSFSGGASGVLPCYLGVTTEALIRLGALDTPLVQDSLTWLVEHQRFDHREAKAGGLSEWPYRAPVNFGCWQSVSCYHGVAGAFRAMAAVPLSQRTPAIEQRLGEAIEYLRIHNLYKKSTSDRPLFRHMTQPSLVADYRSDLLDMLDGVANADPALASEAWVRDAVDDMDDLAADGRVPLVKNYGKKLMDPIPLEPVGEPSRFLTYQWLTVRHKLAGSMR